jgi:hypothetical protein
MNGPKLIHPAYLETHFRHEKAISDWPEKFAIITAFATTGEIWTTERNRSADRALEGEFQASGRWHQRVTGYSTTTGHAEPGWTVEMTLSDACDHGLRYLQDAIYFVSGDQLRGILCEEPRESLLIGSFVSVVPSTLRGLLLQQIHRCHSFRIYDTYEVRPPCGPACRCGL